MRVAERSAGAGLVVVNRFLVRFLEMVSPLRGRLTSSIFWSAREGRRYGGGKTSANLAATCEVLLTVGVAFRRQAYERERATPPHEFAATPRGRRMLRPNRRVGGPPTIGGGGRFRRSFRCVVTPHTRKGAEAKHERRRAAKLLDKKRRSINKKGWWVGVWAGLVVVLRFDM